MPLPKHLEKARHSDWIFPFSYIPRAWTAVDWGEPKKLLGNQPLEGGILKPIGPAQTWQISYYPKAPLWAKITGLAFYVAYSGKRGEDGKFRHFRCGTRRDNIDGYSTILSIASRRYSGDDSQPTGV